MNGSQVVVGGVGGGSGIGGSAQLVPPKSPGARTMGSGTGSSLTEREGTVRSDTTLIQRPAPSPAPFGFLSTAPIAMRFARGDKGDADSLRTDFLQV